MLETHQTNVSRKILPTHTEAFSALRDPKNLFFLLEIIEALRLGIIKPHGNSAA